MADFKKQGGSLTGREERYDGFEGEPRAVAGALGGGSPTGDTSHTSPLNSHDSHNPSHLGKTHGTGVDGTTGKKPGLMDKLNPTKDSDGDGKKGFMN